MRYKRKRDKCFWTMARSYLHDYMPAIRNLSDKTIETYKQSLKTYLRFLKEKKNIEDEFYDMGVFKWIIPSKFLYRKISESCK